MDCIYLDNNATTPLLPAVWECMRPYVTEVFGNPASAHAAGRRARRALEDAREAIASHLGAAADEVLFTSGATEANNLALFGLCGDPPGHLLASPVEHPSVAEPLRRLAEIGFTLDTLPVDAQGCVGADALPDRLRPDTRLVAVMLANHETGALQPIRALTETVAAMHSGCLRNPARFHCDATQAVGKIPVHFRDLGVETLALSAHKLHGPKGIGALLVRRGVKLRPRTWGGHQQHGRRPGTEPVALAVGLACALDHAYREMNDRLAHVRRLRRLFLDYLNAKAVPIILNGPDDRRDADPTDRRDAGPTGIPHTINLSFPGLKADVLLMNLDLAGIACSTGSACSSGSLLPSPVLQAMGVPDAVLRSAMRFSLSPLLTVDDIDEAARRIAAVVARLRRG
ncbi:MAG TPA: cysteine desulfurase family protein [Gemmataceae bacterium]|nr:cysteine desulfurase family protein [Gemmataceae bacterium]